MMVNLRAISQFASTSTVDLNACDLQQLLGEKNSAEFVGNSFDGRFGSSILFAVAESKALKASIGKNPILLVGEPLAAYGSGEVHAFDTTRLRYLGERIQKQNGQQFDNKVLRYQYGAAIDWMSLCYFIKLEF